MPQLRETEAFALGMECPRCRTLLEASRGEMCCRGGHRWPVRDGIPDFLGDFPYWGEIPLEQMTEINATARSGYWKSAVVNSADPEVKRASEMILNLERANWHWLADRAQRSRVLDVGAGMGTTAHSLSRWFEEVVAVEPVRERVEFMRLRFSQEGIGNVRVIRSSIWDIPFPAESFDVIGMNGVLEWVATGRPGDPRELQRTALRNAWELLRPGGYLYVGIENRMPVGYFLGAPDVHCGLPWVTVLPRRLANWYAKQRGHSDGYRNYLYSAHGYGKLMRSAGFDEVNMYLAVPSYNSPRYFLPMRENVFSYYSATYNPVHNGRLVRVAHGLFARLGLLKYVQNSFAIIARKRCR
jgi:SAM-dependent methyltransferase